MGLSHFQNAKITGIKMVLPKKCINIEDEIHFYNNNPKLLTRNKKILGNPYVNSNVGVETYLLELGYITNKNDMYNMKNNTDKYAEAIYKAIKGLKK